MSEREMSERERDSQLLGKVLEQSVYQTQLLTRIVHHLEVATCELEKISRHTCCACNELHWQTETQDVLTADVAKLLEFARIGNPAATLELERLDQLRGELQECCPKEIERVAVCEFEPCDDADDKPGSGDTEEGTAPPKRVKDAPYPAVVRPDRPATHPNTRPPRIVPDGPTRGLISESTGTAPLEMGSAADDPVVFGVYTSDPTVTPASANAADISGAQSEGVVLLSANWYIDYSTDGGTTFTTLDPTTIFPETLAGGFCCDQVVQYVPRIDRFVWLLQYSQSAGPNAYRLASASPQDVIDSGCTAWTYWDLTSATFGFGTDWMDYPSMSIGDNFAYLSFDVLDSTADTIADNGLVAVRIPLDEIAASATINFRFTNPGDSLVAWGSNVSQNTGDEVFWAGHINNSTLRVFSWAESSTSYFWRSVEIANWPNARLSSLGPNSNDWFLGPGTPPNGFPNNAVIGITRRQNQVWMSWTASNGRGTSGGFNFPHPHVQLVKIDTGSYTSTEQMQIWNPDHSFGYPSLATNSRDEVGITLCWGGGGTLHMNSAVGIMGDFVVWYRDASTWTHTRSGDYVTVRRAGSDPNFFAGFGYFVVQDASTNAGHRFEPYYVLFGRKTDIIR